MSTEGLNSKLNEYIKQDYLPMHMPGHKRNPAFIDPAFKTDITEIDGFDNYHHADGLISEIKSTAADIYKADNAYISVNGSTGLILSAILAVTSESNSKKAIVASNCHISVWHALELAGITPVIVNPEIIEMPFYGPVTPESVEDLLKKDDDYAFVILTSPTYEGIITDTNSIYAITSRYNVPLIIDEAHGAHLGLDKTFPTSNRGDIVIKSIHKTLNAPTGTAVMATYGDLVSPRLLSHYIGLTTTTSPSYVLMSGIDRCLRTIKNECNLIDSWGFEVLMLRAKLAEDLSKLSLFTPQDYIYDPSKLVILTNGFMTGYSLALILRDNYKIEVEAAFPDYIIAMTGIGDTSESLDRFYKAIIAIDSEITSDSKCVIKRIYSPLKPELKVTFGDAIKAASETVSTSDSIGRVSSEYIFAYPPGVPLIFPGEVITEDKIRVLSDLNKEGASIVIDPDRKYSGEMRVMVDI